MALRKWGGSFPLVDHMDDGNPKEKMKKNKERRMREREENEKMR